MIDLNGLFGLTIILDTAIKITSNIIIIMIKISVFIEYNDITCFNCGLFHLPAIRNRAGVKISHILILLLKVDFSLGSVDIKKEKRIINPPINAMNSKILLHSFIKKIFSQTLTIATIDTSIKIVIEFESTMALAIIVNVIKIIEIEIAKLKSLIYKISIIKTFLAFLLCLDLLLLELRVSFLC